MTWYQTITILEILFGSLFFVLYIGYLLRVRKVAAFFKQRPHVVWFGEPVPMYENAMVSIQQAEILVIIGTSLNVYPAAGLIHYTMKAKRKVLIDPKGHDLMVPNDFEIINLGAEDGMNHFVSTLH